MNAKAAKWYDQAERRLRAAEFLLMMPGEASHDSICMEAHDAVERYLKACLFELELPLIRTHELVDILEQFVGDRPEWHILEQPLIDLTALFRSFRYPGDQADATDADEAVRIARQVQQLARELLGPGSKP